MKSYLIAIVAILVNTGVIYLYRRVLTHSWITIILLITYIIVYLYVLNKALKLVDSKFQTYDDEDYDIEDEDYEEKEDDFGNNIFVGATMLIPSFIVDCVL